MVYDSENIFAKIINKKLSTKIVMENEHAIAFDDIAPKAPIHILIIPKGKYVKNFASFKINRKSRKFEVISRAGSKVLRKISLF